MIRFGHVQFSLGFNSNLRTLLLPSFCTYSYPDRSINVVAVAVTPLCENLHDPKATKPGGVIYAMNDISVEVDNTDAEGCLVLADMFYYATTELKLHIVTTLTRAIDIALGEIYTGVFTIFDALLNRLLPERASTIASGACPLTRQRSDLFVQRRLV
ncbi:cytosol aminopeptidase family, catalytic domain-containing protein [Suillus lakei]|nr:cytosol aminopeptidase family, catalytic domain-containing protein [Suillus lakei]